MVIEADRVGTVIIGRNEASRLEGCLRSVLACCDRLIYVDSGSGDGSPDIAHALGVPLLRLSSGPHSAARGRQAGLTALIESHPRVEYVQFVDGDCRLHPRWLAAAAGALHEHPRYGAVCGILRERRREQSLLIRLADADWRRDAGPIDSIGGVLMVRLRAIQQAGGWASDLVVGEDMDLSARLRGQGWQLVRLAVPMAEHDLGIRSLGEFWRRSVRTGVSYADLALRYGPAAYPRWSRQAISDLAYGIGLPLALPAACLWCPPIALLIASAYLVLLARIARRQVRAGQGVGFACLYSGTVLMGKAAAALGVLKVMRHRLRRRSIPLMEYKSVRNIRVQTNRMP